MAVVSFDPKANAVYLVGHLEGDILRRVDLVLDTGASWTVLTPQALRAAGFDPAMGTSFGVTTASRIEQVNLLTINRLQVAEQSVPDLEVASMNLPSGLRADGLLGLNFLRHFHLFLNFPKGLLVLQEQPPRDLLHKMAQWWELSLAFWQRGMRL